MVAKKKADDARLHREAVIVAQNATQPAADLVRVIVEANPEHPTTTESVKLLFAELHEAVFTSSMSLGGVVDVEAFIASSAAASGTAAPSSDPGAVEFRYGKNKGKTIAQVHAEAPEDLTWAAANLRNEYMVRCIKDFLSRQS